MDPAIKIHKNFQIFCQIFELCDFPHGNVWNGIGPTRRQTIFFVSFEASVCHGQGCRVLLGMGINSSHLKNDGILISWVYGC